MAASILLADTRSSILSALKLLLEQQDGLRVVATATSTDQILACVEKEEPRILLIECDMLQNVPSDWLEMLQDRSPRLAIIVMCNTPIAHCYQHPAGVTDHISKSDPPEFLLATLRKEIERPDLH
jgi:DNA-binding NarL/FixJ family response regulator